MAKITGLEKMNLADLKDLKVRVEQALVEREKSERIQVRQKIEAMAAQAGFSIDEVIGKSSGSKGSKVAIKYRNPKDSSQTWTGRGRMPIWLAEAIKKGAKRDSFLV